MVSLHRPESSPDLPPWIVYDRKDGTADILPAGRPGAVLEGLPLALAEALVRTANAYAFSHGAVPP